MTYKTRAMATYHADTGCPLDRDLGILTEDPEHADIDNETPTPQMPKLP